MALYWNESSQSFVTAYTSSDGTTNTNIAVTSYANITTGNIVASAISVSGVDFTTNVVSLQSQISGANTAIVTANTAMKAYVDAANTIQSSQIATLQGQVYTNANVAAYLPSYGGNLTVGNVITANGVFWPNGSPYSSGGSGTGITYTASNTVPSSPHVGDQWYYQAADTLYEYINDGTQNVWVDIQSSPTSAGVGSAVTGNLTVNGNLIVTANSYLSNSFVSGTETVTTLVTTGNATVNGNLTVTANTYLANTTVVGTQTVTTLITTGNTTVRGNLFVSSNAAAGTVTRIEYNIPHPFMLMGAS